MLLLTAVLPDNKNHFQEDFMFDLFPLAFHFSRSQNGTLKNFCSSKME